MVIDENIIPNFAIILRTCDLISHKYVFSNSLYENKKLHLLNLVKYANQNKADIFIICDTRNNDYFDFVCELIGERGRVIRSHVCSNGGSFSKQLQLAASLPHRYIEIAEDDFIKFGRINFEALDANTFYTAYDHPLHNRFLYRLLSKLFNNEFSTVCSFVSSADLLRSNLDSFLNFGDQTDAETWREITTPWWLEALFNAKNGKFKFSLIRKSRIKRLIDVTWIHIASDSLPKRYDYLRKIKLSDFILEVNSLHE